MINELKEKIKVSKELLDTLPKNNIKNKKKYKDTLLETVSEYKNDLLEVEKVIDERYNKLRYINEEQTSNDIEQINYLKQKLFLLNKYNSSYEKLNFDKTLYKLNHFYKLDLTEVNNNIINCIEKFDVVGIKLHAEDFDYSEYAYEYMKVLLNNHDDFEKIKDSFEKIYWQCSDLFIHIELNIKYLYYKNKNIFEKYINAEKTKFLKQFSSPLEKFNELTTSYEKHKQESLKRGLKKFANKIWNINDYQELKVNKYYSFFTSENPDKEINEEIEKLSHSAYEYKNLLSFNYIINDIKKKYEEKSNQKNALKNINKKIIKNESLIHKYNKKKNKKEKINTKILFLIQELETLYEELDEITFYDRVFKYLNEDSSIYDALSLVCSHYLYLAKCIKENDIEVNSENEHLRLINFLLNPYNNLIMNVAITENRDLALVISDRYKLSNFNILKDNLSTTEGLDEIIENAEKIKIYNRVVTKLSYDNLKFVVQTKEMFKK